MFTKAIMSQRSCPKVVSLLLLGDPRGRPSPFPGFSHRYVICGKGRTLATGDKKYHVAVNGITVRFRTRAQGPRIKNAALSIIVQSPEK